MSDQGAKANPYDVAVAGGLGGILAIGVVSWAALVIDTAVSGNRAFHPTFADGLDAWAHLGDMGALVPKNPLAAPSGPLFVVLAVTLAAAVVGLVLAAWHWRKVIAAPSASRHRSVLGAKTLLARADVLRPRTAQQAADPQVRRHLADVRSLGIYLGHSEVAGDLWGSAEDSYIVIGPPRTGKTTRLIIPRILEWPGAVLSTSVRPDVAKATAERRKANAGRVFGFDPEGDLDAGLEPLRWSLTAGCENPTIAQRRAAAMASHGGFGDVSGGGFWQQSTQGLLRLCFHAAGLCGAGIDQVMSWLHETTFALALCALDDQAAAPGWKEQLERLVNMGAAETKEGIIAGAVSSLEAFTDPAIAAAFSPRDSESLDLERFLATAESLYIACGEGVQAAIAPVVVTLVTEIVEAAKARARRDQRCDPPVLLALDEVANIAPLPGLADLYSTAGGSGITMIGILQSLGQARRRWGPDGAEALWGASTVRIVYGGVASARDLQDITALAGIYERSALSRTWSDAGQSTSSSTERIERIRPEDLYGLAPGKALVIARGLAPIEVRTGPSPHKAEMHSLAEHMRTAASVPDAAANLTS